MVLDDQATLSFIGDCVRSVRPIFDQLLFDVCNLSSVSFIREFSCFRLLLYMVNEVPLVLLHTFQLQGVSVNLPHEIPLVLLRTFQLHGLDIELPSDFDAVVLIRSANLAVVRLASRGEDRGQGNIPPER